MKTNKIGGYDKTSFGQLNIKRSANLTEQVAEAIASSPAMKKMDKRYNADVYYQQFTDTTGTKSYKGLVIDNIEPKNIFVSVWDTLRGVMPGLGNFVQYNSFKATEKEFVEAIKGLGKNEIFDRYHP